MINFKSYCHGRPDRYVARVKGLGRPNTIRGFAAGPMSFAAA